MKTLGLSGAGSRRLFTRQTFLIALAICIIWGLAIQFSGDVSQQWSQLKNHMPNFSGQPKRMPTHNVLPPLAERVACYGPRGLLLGESPDDDLEASVIDGRM